MMAGLDLMMGVQQVALHAPGAINGIDWTQIILYIVAGLFGGGAFWGFLKATRSATTGEYQAFVKDQRREMHRLGRRIEQSEMRIAHQELEIADLILHQARLEAEIIKMGGTPPARPQRRLWTPPARDDDEDDEPTPPATH